MNEALRILGFKAIDLGVHSNYICLNVSLIEA